MLIYNQIKGLKILHNKEPLDARCAAASFLKLVDFKGINEILFSYAQELLCIH